MRPNLHITAYHDTVLEDRATRHRYAAQASRQERRILAYFHYHRAASPSMVWKALGGHSPGAMPITSVRRAITNLTQRGLLEKTNRTMRGHWGRAEHIWAAPPRQQVLL